jgi:type VI secretion system protein ImpM
MRCGLYGKLPSKRDFIAQGTPREFLSVWEAWLQGGVSSSRAVLGERWQDAFLRAPIWRFWLGADICGRSIAGAFTPSVDGVGRYFPLSVFACGDAGEAIPPPELDPQEPWFAALEDFLLLALHSEGGYEAVAGAFEALPPPADRLPGPLAEGVAYLANGSVYARIGPDSLEAGLRGARAAAYPAAYAGASMWWTIGGEDFAPLALVARKMPDPYLFAGLLTGDFEAALQTNATG